MNKKTKMLIGVGAVALVGYYFWNKSQNKSFANLTSSSTRPLQACKTSPKNYQTYTDPTGKPIYDCCGIGKTGYALGTLVDTCPIEATKATAF